MSMSKLDENFKLVVNVLNKNNIVFWICHGTLLGIIRDKKLIEWDNDVDIAVWKSNNNKKKIEMLLISNGFKKKKKFFDNDNLLTLTRRNGKEVDINFYEKPYSSKYTYQRHYDFKNFVCRIIYVLSRGKKYNGNYKSIVKLLSPLSIFFKIIKKKLIEKKLFYNEIGYMTPKIHFNNLCKINFQNLKVYLPYNHKMYLRNIYGANWKVPKKNYKWTLDSPSSKKI